MAVTAKLIQVWAAEIDDSPGGLARILEPLALAGAELECVIARRCPDKSGKAVVFVAPIKGKKVEEGARKAGVQPAENLATLRVEGPDRKGLGAKMTRAVAQAGVSMRGLSTMVMGKKFVSYFGFDNAADAERAAMSIKAIK